MSERTLVLIKPDGVRRGLIGDVIARIERKGLTIAAMELRQLDADTAKTHYAEHSERPFFGELVDFITSAPLVALVVEGPRAIEAFRGLAGLTDPVKSAPGTIRGDHALEIGENVVHGSDSPESAAREIKIFFPDRF
ncbi:nucleoside-diphosphate kinase [Herbidospora galbida]|uniref:Nucleoside diphosphate kinase n=1 Tax=Herbidospora galbida TaxID=2575442 RepID=A0A4U3MIR4_9ACTN|nr:MULTISPECIES: nucleoside-diphosphate kinase [Herbidospora]TKK87907.1 nucleoside-diphosphate kinase [Herbidospora galbida]